MRLAIAAQRASGAAVVALREALRSIVPGGREGHHALVPEDTAIDGEIVAVDADGKSSFVLLQGSGAGSALVVFRCLRPLDGAGKPR